MRCSVYIHTALGLSIAVGLATAQLGYTASQSCYLTSTVIYGNSTSSSREPVPSSLSTTSTAQTSLSVDGSNSQQMSTSGLSTSIQDSSSTTAGSSPTVFISSSTTSGSVPPPTSSPFIVQVSGFDGPLQKRETVFLTFVEGVAYLYPGKDQAAVLAVTSDAQLISGEQYCGTNTYTGAVPLLQYVARQPAEYPWAFEGTTLKFGNTSFAAGRDRMLYVLFNGSPPPDGVVQYDFVHSPAFDYHHNQFIECSIAKHYYYIVQPDGISGDSVHYWSLEHCVGKLFPHDKQSIDIKHVPGTFYYSVHDKYRDDDIDNNDDLPAYIIIIFHNSDIVEPVSLKLKFKLNVVIILLLGKPKQQKLKLKLVVHGNIDLNVDHHHVVFVNIHGFHQHHHNQHFHFIYNHYNWIYNNLVIIIIIIINIISFSFSFLIPRKTRSRIHQRHNPSLLSPSLALHILVLQLLLAPQRQRQPNVQYSIAQYGTDAIFGFNEPDACFSGKSACMSLSRSLQGYVEYMQPFARASASTSGSGGGGSVLIGAPAVTNSGTSGLTYLSYFLGNATQLGLQIDFLNLHWHTNRLEGRIIRFG
ncbi:hypothetical protein ABEF95_011622 [Exophiala dermatitidis]